MPAPTPVQTVSGRRTLASVLLPPALVVIAFFLIETALFSSRGYGPWVFPDSTAGIAEVTLYNERHRKIEGPQVVTIGDSRMGGFRPLYTDPLRAELGYTFATIAVPGTTPRCWYYLLRDIDPRQDRYRAIVIGMDDFDDDEIDEDVSTRLLDLRYVINRVGWGDAVEFARSYPTAELGWQAFSGVMLKGTVYHEDLQDFLRDPRKRIETVQLNHRDSWHWFYNFEGTADSMAGVEIDWAKKTLVAPPGIPEGRRDGLARRLFGERPAPVGRHAGYLRRWLGAIAELYAHSETKILFARLPRGPYVRPDQLPDNPGATVRELARRYPNVGLLPEHGFESLERPELFSDEIHLNGPGMREFSPLLARETRAALGPAAGAR